jgi:hypothetical protein
MSNTDERVKRADSAVRSPPHIYKRMADRDFTEVDVRSMLQTTTRLRRDVEPGRWVALTRLRRQRWEIILEPDLAEQRLVVITAYPIAP